MKINFLAAMVVAAFSMSAVAENECNLSYESDVVEFVSSSAVSKHDVEACAASFIENYYNLSPATALDRTDKALKVMSPSLRSTQMSPLKSLAKQAVEQEVTQRFTAENGFSVKEDAGRGYIVEFRGQRIRSTFSRVFSTRKYDVKLLIRPIQPSANFNWALVVDDLTAQEI